MHKASFMTVFANTLVGWLRLTVSMLLLFSGLFIILCFNTILASLNFHEWRVPSVPTLCVTYVTEGYPPTPMSHGRVYEIN